MEHLPEKARQRGGCQVSILWILGATTMIALICGAIVAVSRSSGMQATGVWLLAARHMVFNGPAAVIWIVALVLFHNRRHRHPEVSWYGVLASGGMLALIVVSLLFHTWADATLRYRINTVNGTRFAWLTIAFQAIVSLLRAGCWVMILMAALGWRQSPRPSDS